MNTRRALALAAGLVAGMLALQEPAQAEQVSRLDVGNWHGGAYTDDGTGAFSHCAVSAEYRSGITLVFSVDGTLNWAVGLANDAWKLTEGDSYQVRYWVDRGADRIATAGVVATNQVKIPLPPDDRLFHAFRRGRMLTIVAANQTMEFSLTSTSRMLSTLLKCADRWRGYRPVAPSNPFSGTGNPFSNEPPKSDNPFSDTRASPTPRRSAPAAGTTGA